MARLRVWVKVFGSSRPLPGGSRLAPGCSSFLDGACWIVHQYINRLTTPPTGWITIIQNSLTRGRLLLWIGSRSPLIFSFICKLKGKICPKMPGDCCLKAGAETATAFCVEMHSFWWWRIASDAQSWISRPDVTIWSVARKFIFWNENQIQFPLYTSHLNRTLRPALLLASSPDQSKSGFCVCRPTGWRKPAACYAPRSG